VVFFQRKNPQSVLAWLLILFFIPVIGFIFYLLIGSDVHKRRIFRTKEIEDRLSELIRNQSLEARNKELSLDDEILDRYSDLILYNLETSGAVLTEGNEVAIINDGKEKFTRLLEDLRRAQETIHIQYYIIRADEVFAEIVTVLRERAKAGVAVRILYDCMGCRHMKGKYWRALRKEGLQVAGFFPAWLGRLHLRVNYRNHRKIVVIDNRVAYVGGFNIGREYIGEVKRFGYWRDSHLRIVGRAALALQARFILDWNYAAPRLHLGQEQYLVEPGDFPYGACLDIDSACAVQIITNGPDTRRQNIRDNYLRLISKAKKSIYIQTPYFIPDDAIKSALTIAIYSGVEVNIMIPDKPDHPFVYWATYAHIGEMIMAGANCYTYRDGFIHAKAMVVDDEVLCCGTANMDIRSFALNFEVNATVYNVAKAKEMSAAFREDLRHCHLVTKDGYLGRSLPVRFKEQLFRIFSPLL
jgi:cardiolipin synthase